MDACNAVDRELDKVLTKLQLFSNQFTTSLDDLIRKTLDLKSEIDEDSANSMSADVEKIDLVKLQLKKIPMDLQKAISDHRDLHSSVSKIGKAIDRNFSSDFIVAAKPDVFSKCDKINIINRVICEHFYRLGLKDIADELAKEAAVDCLDFDQKPFIELNFILDRLKVRDLEPALHWAEEHKENLEKQNSTLHFKLHRLRFISIIEKGPIGQTEAIIYARTYFKQFVKRHEKEIQNLMGMFLYLPNGIQNSPYEYLLQQDMWLEILDVFTHDACSILNLSVDSPLAVCINAGCSALPALLNIKQVMQQRQVNTFLSGKDELPIEINLGQKHRYHSVFSCPILRQQATTNNPPMKLLCGHVISRDALNKLCQGTNKLKCPYCPLEQSANEAKQIYF